MLGELSQKYPAESTENANAEEKTVSREELVKNVNKAQDAYDIAEEEYNASKTLVESYKAEMDSYAASRNGTTWHDRQDAWQKKYDEARGDWETEKGNLGGKQKNYENAKNALTEAQSVLENYKDPQEKIIAEFLLEMLNVNPDPTILESYIEELNNRITELKTNTDIIGNYSGLVADTQVLTVLVKNYVFWVKETSENDSEINTMLGELGKEIQIPDPDSQTFNEQYASWEETWQNRINCLENLIQELPQFFESQKKELKNTVINTELLSEYNANEKMSILDELRRSKVSDINVIEKVCSLLFGKYRGIAWFSLGLAVFFDISSLLAGLFIYGLSKKKAKN